MGTVVNIGTLVGAYVESPAQSGYYTFDDGVHIETPPGSGLYSVGPLTQSSTGLYDIPKLTFSALGYMRGLTSNLTGFSAQEDATTIDPSNYSGGAGQVTVNALAADNSLLALSKDMFLQNSEAGTIQTIVRDVSESDESLTIVADSPLGLFNSEHVVQPQTGTFRQAVSYYMGLVGMTSDLSIDNSIGNRAVAYPGWVGNVWDHLKQILAAEQVEIAVVLGTVIVRHIRTQTATLKRSTTLSRGINKQSAARRVEIFWYNNRKIANGEVYPVASEEEDPSPAQVDANGTTTFTVQMDASLSSVNQPVCVDWVDDKDYSGTLGVYSVAGSDGKPVTAAQWTAQGGSLTVRMTEDPSVLEVTVRGASNTELAPYRIAMTSGNYYNSLHITGTGVAWKADSTILTTGATNSVTGENIGTTVENPFIDTYAKALRTGQQTSKNYAVTHTVSGSVQSVDDQIFGNTAGARINIKDAYYRINSVTVSPSGTTFDGTEDTTMSDFSAVWSGKTMAEFADEWSGKTMLDFATTPLRS